MSGFSQLWQSLSEPDDFSGNPYGRLSNQFGHMMLGVTLWVICTVCVAIFTQLDYTYHVVAAVSVAYILVKELPDMRSCGFTASSIRDSFYDTCFVTCGALIVAAAGHNIVIAAAACLAGSVGALALAVAGGSNG